MPSNSQPIMHVIFLIFTGTALLSTAALFTRQSLLVAYIALGALLGPYGLKAISDTPLINEVGNMGIIFLLFLLGLDLQPSSLLHSLRKMSLIALISSLIFLIFGIGIGKLCGFSAMATFVVGISMMFSSTIIGIKLLPTTILHHQHTGELMISILLLQDIIAIAVLLILHAASDHLLSWHGIGTLFIAFPLLLAMGYTFQRFLLAPLMARFDSIHEYIFILSIGWCLCMAETAHMMGLSEEIGAFIAGIALASHPISLYIAESLKPLRDFFLVIFFFAIGAEFNFSYLPSIWLPTLLLAGVALLLKPLVFGFLLNRTGESRPVGFEIGVRLGQISEFSLLISYVASSTQLITPTIAYTIQAATLLTFIVSCYWVVLRYPTPLASTERLRRD